MIRPFLFPRPFLKEKECLPSMSDDVLVFIVDEAMVACKGEGIFKEILCDGRVEFYYVKLEEM